MPIDEINLYSGSISNENSGVVLAAGAHPDDIEFMMSGTLFQLRRAGWEVHYLNIANGCCGTATVSHDEIVRIRTQESRDACSLLGATFHKPLVDDIQIYYCPDLAARLCAIVRKIRPSILLLQSPEDYMEDHTNSVRLMVTAAFCRGMLNFATDPTTPIWAGDMAIYHALPYGLHDNLRQPINPEFCVDVSPVIHEKQAMLSCHRSQKEWLDVSQGMDSYLQTLIDMSADVGRISGQFAFAEGWRRHLHLGFGPVEFNPLVTALGEHVVWTPPAS